CLVAAGCGCRCRLLYCADGARHLARRDDDRGDPVYRSCALRRGKVHVMCAICGCVGRAASRARVAAMLQRMAHRGPDAEGTWGDQSWILGHRRLAIVDLSDAGRQPMLTDDRMLVTVVNGEIYNYPQLRCTLEKSGAIFRSHCDSEVVLHAYRAWGTASFSR